MSMEDTFAPSARFLESCRVNNGVLRKFRYYDDPTVTIDDSVSVIGRKAFAFSRRITGVWIPASVQAIRSFAFAGCEYLSDVRFMPTAGAVLGDHAFYDCTSLARLVLPEGLVSIERYAFKGCSRLEEITLPASLVSIGAYAFFGCVGLRTIRFLGTEEQWAALERGKEWDYLCPAYRLVCADTPAA